jgi:hypothetical protein
MSVGGFAEGRRAGSGQQILGILSLMADVKYVDGIPPDRKEDLVGIEQSLVDGFGEEHLRLPRDPQLAFE